MSLSYEIGKMLELKEINLFESYSVEISNRYRNNEKIMKSLEIIRSLGSTSDPLYNNNVNNISLEMFKVEYEEYLKFLALKKPDEVNKNETIRKAEYMIENFNFLYANNMMSGDFIKWFIKDINKFEIEKENWINIMEFRGILNRSLNGKTYITYNQDQNP